MKITIAVQSAGKGRWRLGLNTFDSINYFKHKEIVIFELGEEIFQAKTVCGTSLKKAFDFNGEKISEWIIKNKFNIYEKSSPTKLIFNFKKVNETKVLKFEKIVSK